MVAVTYRWEGLAETNREIDRFIGDYRARVRRAAEDYGKTTTERMKANHDRDAHDIQRYVNRTWYLTRSIEYDVRPWSGDRLEIRIYTPAYYAHWVENGTPRSRAYPFFWVEVYGQQPYAVTRIWEEVMDAVKYHEAVERASRPRTVTTRTATVPVASMGSLV